MVNGMVISIITAASNVLLFRRSFIDITVSRPL